MKSRVTEGKMTAENKCETGTAEKQNLVQPTKAATSLSIIKAPNREKSLMLLLIHGDTSQAVFDEA